MTNVFLMQVFEGKTEVLIELIELININEGLGDWSDSYKFKGIFCWKYCLVIIEVLDLIKFLSDFKEQKFFLEIYTPNTFNNEIQWGIKHDQELQENRFFNNSDTETILIHNYLLERLVLRWNRSVKYQIW